MAEIICQKISRFLHADDKDNQEAMTIPQHFLQKQTSLKSHLPALHRKKHNNIVNRHVSVNNLMYLHLSKNAEFHMSISHETLNYEM